MREPRQPVRIGARLKSARGWSDLTIRNVSPGGVMAVSDSPPARGDYVEIRCGTYIVVARVAWTEDDAFGAQSQYRIELRDLLSGGSERLPLPGERRRLPRVDASAGLSIEEQAQRSLRMGRTLDFVSLAVAGAMFAGLVTSAAYQALVTPLRSAAQAMSAPAQESESIR